MRKIYSTLWLVSIGLLFVHCTQNNPDLIISSADYNPKTNFLKVDYLNKPDTSLLEIIALSNIRKSGYGVLLNMEGSYSGPELDALKLKFKRQDVNAVHSFEIIVVEALQNNIHIAMDGAKFIWLLDKKDINLNSTSLGKTVAALQDKKEDKPLIVISKN